MIQKEMIEIKNAKELSNVSEELISRLDRRKERIDDHEHMSRETSCNEMKRKKEFKNGTDSRDRCSLHSLEEQLSLGFGR
jgi:hypothetical protein